MSGPILFFVVVVVIDLVLKSVREKKKVDENRERMTPSPTKTSTTKPQVDRERSGGALRDLRRMMEEEFQKQSGNIENLDPRRAESMETRNKPIVDDTPIKRENTAKKTREELIQNQKDKINKHSELEKSRRLQKDQMFTSSRLSDSQVTLASQHINGGDDNDYDFSTRKPVTIGLKDTSRAKGQSRSLGILNIKEDIIRGVIYSEILGKPKSMKK